MNSFTYYAPTRVIFGKNAEAQVGELVCQQRCKKVLLHYGGNSARRGIGETGFAEHRLSFIKRQRL